MKVTLNTAIRHNALGEFIRVGQVVRVYDTGYGEAYDIAWTDGTTSEAIFPGMLNSARWEILG